MYSKDDASYERLLQFEWCKKLIEQPETRMALLKVPASEPDLEGVLMGRTLNTEDTVRAALCLYKVKDSQITEVTVLFDVGNGLNGLPGALHGGMVATLLDEACGLFVAAVTGPEAQNLLDADGKHRIATICPSKTEATIYLNVTYLKFVKTPSVIAAKAWLKERSGRKLFVNAQFEDQHGTPLARAESLFITHKLAKL